MSQNKRFYWIKLQSDFFSSLRIKKLRKLAGGDTFTIIYLKMQLLSLNNDGVIEYKGIESTFEEEMALELDEDVDNVRITIQYLLSCGLMECNNDEFTLPYVIENTGSCASDEQYKENHRLRQQRYRERKKALCDANVTSPVTDSDVCVTEKRDVEKEIEKEIEKDKEIEIDIDTLIEQYNTICINLPKVSKVTEGRKRTIKSRLKKYSVDEIIEVFEKTNESDFLSGRNNNKWKADFDWLMKENNMVKVLEGNYTNRCNSTSSIADIWRDVQ